MLCIRQFPMTKRPHPRICRKRKCSALSELEHSSVEKPNRTLPRSNRTENYINEIQKSYGKMASESPRDDPGPYSRDEEELAVSCKTTLSIRSKTNQTCFFAPSEELFPDSFTAHITQNLLKSCLWELRVRISICQISEGTCYQPPVVCRIPTEHVCILLVSLFSHSKKESSRIRQE